MPPEGVLEGTPKFRMPVPFAILKPKLVSEVGARRTFLVARVPVVARGSEKSTKAEGILTRIADVRAKVRGPAARLH